MSLPSPPLRVLVTCAFSSGSITFVSLLLPASLGTCDPCSAPWTPKVKHEFPGCLDICGEGTPQVTGFFEVTVAGKLVHSKKRGDGYVDTESKFRKLVTAIKAALAQCQ
uniref:Selenoprotein W n=1 Tax=Rattus norvegicus TaxID=10116 RepID=A0ABK0LWC0_RAT